MPYIPFYADEKDCKYIRKFLNQHPEVAFIISDGPHRWRATKSVLRLKADTCLWHIPSGPLPLLHPHPSNRIDSIHDPWNGWKELSPGADRDSPYFGPGHPGVI